MNGTKENILTFACPKTFTFSDSVIIFVDVSAKVMTRADLNFQRANQTETWLNQFAWPST